MSEFSDKLRREFKANDDIRDAGLTTPRDVERFDDIRYGEESPWQALDLYRPANAQGRILPVIVSVHGGAWMYGDKERYQYYCMSLARRGFAVVNFSYRLAPEYKWPAGMEDTNSAFHWVFDHSAEYGLDTGHIFAVGDSAGGHMLSIYCCICTNPEYAARYAFEPPRGFAPTAVALNCGAYLMNAERAALMAELLPGGGTAEEAAFISPLPHMTSDFPQAFVMTCTGDQLKHHAAAMFARLSELDVPFTFRYYGDKDTTLGHVFHCNIRLEEARRCNDEECDFFRRFL